MDLTADTIWGYLTARGLRPVRVRELGGGVSSAVFWVDTPDDAMVVKQSLEKLRVKADWHADPGRSQTEARAVRDLHPLLPAGTIPAVRWEDAQEHVVALEAVPAASWKDELLMGRLDPDVARDAGTLLGALIRTTWGRQELLESYSDLSSFEELRLQPYYGTIASRHPDVRRAVDEACAQARELRQCLVHGDYSPKNLLVRRPGVTIIDFEVAHAGDPGFDVAFCLSLLFVGGFFQPSRWTLRLALLRAFLDALEAAAPPQAHGLAEQSLRHLGLLVLARVDGKSPVEYLRDPRLRDHVRNAARGLILERPRTYAEALERWGHEVTSASG